MTLLSDSNCVSTDLSNAACHENSVLETEVWEFLP